MATESPLSKSSAHRVLILTGGLITAKENSFWRLLKKQISQWQESQHQWLELKIKVLLAEPYIFIEREKKKFLRSAPTSELKNFLEREENFDSAELTEVALTTLLKAQKIEYELANYDDAFLATESFAQKREACDVLFFSTTFLRDLSELLPMIKRVATRRHKVVIGGALTGTLRKKWQGDPCVDIVTVGYGEYLIPCLASWIKSDFKTLPEPPYGSIEKREGSLFLISGVPKTLSLDFIEKPDWAQSQKDRNTKYSMISYESVRGCPYRCAFCNYPYLFDDTKFRTKSAVKMAQDWLEYSQELEAPYITCLDSLFTMPKYRLVEFCRKLIEQNNRLKWICYARADDLADESVVQLMVQAGAIQVQIGIESGDDQILKNMNKRTDSVTNSKALENCRKYGLTSVATIIVGFPGETKESVERTYEFLKKSPPDFFFIATFSTRVPGVPILLDENKAKYNLVTMENAYTVSPYWKHESMDCLKAADFSRRLLTNLIQNEVSIDAMSFYKNILRFQPEFRDELLTLQARAARKSLQMKWIFDRIHSFLNRKLEKDMAQSLTTPA